MLAAMSPEVRRSLWALLPCAFVYLYVFPYFPEINNPNENVRFYMTAAIVEEGRYEINTMRERWGWTNDAACVDRAPNGALEPCVRRRPAQGVSRDYYSVKSPGTSLLGVPAYAAYRRLSGARFDRTAAIRAVRITASIIPALLFLFFFHLWMRSQVESAFVRNATFFSMALGSAFCAYTFLFTSHTQSAICGFGAFMLLERAQRLKRIGVLSAGLAGFLAAGATAFEYPCVVVSLVLCIFALIAIKSRKHVMVFALGALIPTLAVMHFQWRAFGSPFQPGHLFVETSDFRAAYEQGFFGAIGFQLEAAWRLLFDLRMGLLSMTPIFLAAPIGWWRLVKSPGARSVAWVSLAACVSLYTLICCMNNWSGGWVVGPRYLVVLMPFFAWAAAHGLAWTLERWPSTTTAFGLGATAAAFAAGGLPSTYYPHLPGPFNFPLKDFFVELLVDGFAPMNLGHVLGLHGTLSMTPVFGTWVLVLVWLFRMRGEAKWTAVASLFTALVLLSPQALGPKKSPEAEGLTRHILGRWTPQGFDRESRLARERGERPNVLLISLDTLRADHLPMYGYEYDTAPSLAALAKESVVFDQAYAAHTNTAPSHATMLTGLYPTVHGVRRNGMRLKDAVQTLPQLLKPKGYQTAAFVSGWTMRRHTKLNRGFDLYMDHGLELRERKAPQAYELAREWLTGAVRDGRPFFMMLHMFDPHYLYQPPLEDAQQFLPVGLQPTHRAYPNVPGYGWASLPEESRTKLVARYDGEIYFADRQIGRLLHDLKALGVDDDTLIIFVSDHGETLMDREWGFDHGAQAYDEQIRVPLIIRLPGQAHKGKRVLAQVHHVDLFRTVLDKLSLPVAKSVSGRSLLPLIEGSGKWPKPRAVFSHARPVPKRYRGFRGKPKITERGLVASVRLPEVKLIEYPQENGRVYRELFLLKSDPTESNNVAEEHPELTGALHRQLQRWRTSVGGAGPGPVVDIPEEVQEGLRALGYME